MNCIAGRRDKSEEARVEAVDQIFGPFSGHCLCGLVTFTVSELSLHYHVCHCDMCRRWNGGPSMTVIAKDATFDGEENISVYNSSDWARRAFCTKCGSNLFYRFKQSDDWFLWVGLFDDQSQFAIAQEIYVDKKPPGYAFSGNHPRLTEEEFLESIGLK
jgi:hypothetical protein